MAEQTPRSKMPDDAAPGDEARPPAGAVREVGRFAYDKLERLIHERARLSILSSVSAHAGGLVFNDLKKLCGLTDGNLSRQLQLLQEAGLVEIWKGSKNNRPQTLVRMTERGRGRFLEYIAELERVVADAASAAADAATTPAARRRTGWTPA